MKAKANSRAFQLVKRRIKTERQLEFAATVRELRSDQYQGDKHKVYKNYKKKTSY